MCDCEIPQVQNHKIRTARKVHECAECSEPIKPGDKYEYMSAVLAGEWYHAKTCIKCRSLHDYLVQFHDFCTCYDLGGLAWEVRQEGYLPDGVYENESKDLRLESWVHELLDVKQALDRLRYNDESNNWWFAHRANKLDKEVAK